MDNEEEKMMNDLEKARADFAYWSESLESWMRQKAGAVRAIRRAKRYLKELESQYGDQLELPLVGEEAEDR